MLKEFDREDLEDLYTLVKAKYGSIRPVEDLDLLLWGDLKAMFEPHVEDQNIKFKGGLFELKVILMLLEFLKLILKLILLDGVSIAELKEIMKIIPDKEKVVIDAISLAVKSPKIIDWKIYKEGKKSYYQIIRGGESLKMYLVVNRMLKEFDIEDLKDLYTLVKAKYGSIRPVEDLDLLLWGDLKAMFEPHVEDQVWK
nr:hypothetical protein [Tanacetum cinerariifolium]